MSILRAKMLVTRVIYNKQSDGSISSETVELCPVCSNDPDSDNAKWSKWTPWHKSPSGNLSLTINNPDAFNKVSNGHEFYVDLTPVV